MNDRKLSKAISEAKRFLEFSAAVDREKKQVYAGVQLLDNTMHTAAVRRSSMDLTRALADLRKPS